MAGHEPDISGFAILPLAGGETVYKWFEAGTGPSGSTGPASASWRGLASNHNQIAEIINKAVRDSGASWEGASADAARSGTSPLATWADVTGQSATDAGKTVDTIGQAYSDASNKMQKPPSVPDKPFYNSWVPWDTDYDVAVEKNQQVSERNIEAFNTYASTVTASTDNMPTFISPDPNDVKFEEQGGGKKPIERIDEQYTPPPNVGPPGGGPPGGTPPTGTNKPGDDTNLSGWKPPGTGDDTTNPSKVDPRFPPPPSNDDWRNRPPGSDPNLPPGGRFDPNDPRNPNRPGGPNDPRNRPGGPGGPGGGRGPGGGGGAGGMKPPGAGGIGGAAAAGLGKGPGGMGGAGSGFGGAAGVAGDGRGGAGGGFGPAGGGAAAGRGAAGAAGMGAGGAGAGRGQGEEDKEHKSASYLQETEDIFGDGTMVAPPVIGG